jgi:hypothetical protein
MSQSVLLYSEKIQLFTEIQNSASPASTCLIRLRKDSVGARNFPTARMHRSVVSTMVLKLIASSAVVAFAVFRTVEKMEIGASLVGLVNSRKPLGMQLSHR